MVQNAAINISLYVEDRVIDLRVPRYVVGGRLQELLQDALAGLQVAFPPQWRLEVRGKNVALGDDVPLKDYPLSDGDRLAVVAVGGGKSGEKTEYMTAGQPI